jgi:hypothetical protein
MKYVFIFLSFLSVCTTAELLQIPLTLDAKKTINVPFNAATFKEYRDTLTIKPSDDPDFQRYMNNIRAYTIDSVSFTTSNLTGDYAKYGTIPRYAIFGIYNLETQDLAATNVIDLGTTTSYRLGISGAGLANWANSIQKNGSIKLLMLVQEISETNGGFDLNLKLHTKIKL